MKGDTKMKKEKEEKIIQIIPAPTDMIATYDSMPDIFERVVCLALVEDEHGERTVKPMDCMYDGEISFCADTENFKGIIFSKEALEELERRDLESRE